MILLEYLLRMKDCANISKIKSTMNNNPYKEQIINEAFKFHSQGNIPEAAKYYQYFIDQGFKDQSFFNYGVILKNLGKLKEAELSYIKQLKSNLIMQMHITIWAIY